MVKNDTTIVKQDDLKKRMQEQSKEIMKMQVELARGMHKNVHIVKTLRHELARTQTAIRKEEMKGEVTQL